MSAWGSYSFVYGLLVAGLTVGVLAVLLRWTFARGQSLVARPVRSGAEGDYGLLVPVARFASVIEAELNRSRLTGAGVRATLASTSSGLCVMVFADDERIARAVLRTAR